MNRGEAAPQFLPRDEPAFGMTLALFDFDGTITRGDSCTPFLRFAAGPARKAAAYTTLFPVAVGYHAGLVAGRTARPLFAHVAFRGVESECVRTLGDRYAAEVLPHTIRPRALEQLAWHQRNGDTVVVVSVSLAVYLRPWCERAGLGCIATELEEHRGRFTGRYLGGECTGPERVVRIRQAYELPHYSQIYAYGDTAEDHEMLALASHPFYRWRPPSRPSSIAYCTTPTCSSVGRAAGAPRCTPTCARRQPRSRTHPSRSPAEKWPVLTRRHKRPVFTCPPR